MSDQAWTGHCSLPKRVLGLTLPQQTGSSFNCGRSQVPLATSTYRLKAKLVDSEACLSVRVRKHECCVSLALQPSSAVEGKHRGHNSR